MRSLIQVNRTNPPVVPAGLEEGDPLASSSATHGEAAAQVPAGDPLVRFGAMHGLDPQAQQFGGQQWIERGNKLLMAHRYQEAIDAYREGFRTCPDSAFILNEAAALRDSGRYAEADLAYQRYLSDPNAPRADEAREAQQRARAHLGGRAAQVTDRAEAQRLFDAGLVAFQARRFGDALQAFDSAYERMPLPQIRYNQAACLDKLGLRELAAQRYESYLREAPDAGDADKVLKRITTLREQAREAAHAAFDRGQDAFAKGNFREAAADTHRPPAAGHGAGLMKPGS